MTVLVKGLLCKQGQLSLGQAKKATHSVCWHLVSMSQVSPFRPFETRATHFGFIV